MILEIIAGQTATFGIGVRDSTDATVYKTNPTIDATNDFAISINGGSWDTLDNAPVLEPAGSEAIKIVLSATETTAAGNRGRILLRVSDFDDASGWIGGLVEIHTVAYGRATSNDVTTITSALTIIDDFIDTEIAAIKAKTDALPSDPADASDIATSFTTLTNKLTKYVQLLARKDAAIATDNATELTAINASGGSGAGTFANTTDSVEALRDTLATTADVNALAVIPAASASSSSVSGALTLIRASTFEQTITGVIAPSDWTKAYLTVKAEGQATSADATAVIQLLATEGGDAGDGLKVLNGASATASGGSITINTDDNEVDIILTDDTTSALSTGQYIYDIKFLYGTSKSGRIYTGTITITATPTQTYNQA